VNVEKFVTSLYVGFFGRNPEPGALDIWARRIRLGATPDQIVSDFLDSQEFKDRQKVNSSARQSDVESTNQQLQRIIFNQYRESFENGRRPHARISDTGFRCYSQFEEDGIILYLLAAVGMKTRRVVEICAGDGAECMSANLVLNHGYKGFLFDGDPAKIAAATQFFRGKKDCLLWMPVIKQAWITRENINSLLMEVGAAGEIDLLALDIDGNDYYVWDQISIVQPRICVFEILGVVPKEVSVTIPYYHDFVCDKSGPRHEFRGASLLAMKKLSERKGYRLIGSHRRGFNVFFMRNDVGVGLFPAVEIDEVHHDPLYMGQTTRWPLIKDLPWVQV
jgi:hypothetical protein